MHHLAFILILFTSKVFCGTVVTTKTDLLAVIRQDLRRNNDDYVESTVQTVSEQTFASSKPTKPSSTNQVSVGTLETKNLKTPNNIKTTNNVKTTLNPPSAFRRTFQSIELQPITDKPKHRHKKIDPAQYLITLTESKPTQFTQNFKRKGTGRKNDLYEPQRKTFKHKAKPSTMVEVRTVSESDDELKKVQGFMRELEEKEGQTIKQIPELQQILLTKAQATTKENKLQRMNLVMSKINEAPMVAPIRQKPTATIESSIEEPQAPWEIPRLETTRGVINRVALKTRSSEQLPVLRAVTTKEASKPKLQTGKPKADAKNTGHAEKTKLRQKNSDVNRINELKMKLREGLKLSSLPPGHLLDLWPAIGPRVHAMRMKNKLCQRSVMLNEGPKYDSKGGTYMPRFKPRLLGTKKVIDFPQTKQPIFVLPRCCNCCRKSVLGCE